MISSTRGFCRCTARDLTELALRSEMAQAAACSERPFGLSSDLRRHGQTRWFPLASSMANNATTPTLELFDRSHMERPEVAPSPALPLRSLRTVGLFAGIGGIELGLQAAGHETLEFCEVDEAAVEVLETRFRGLRVAGDIRAYRQLPAGTDLLTAGFPCQDLSQAGKTLGLDGDRSSLVDEVFWLLRHHEIPWVLLENVSFMLRLGRGRAMETIVRTFEELDYRWAYRTVDTRAFGLPQRRKRVFILASREADPRDVLLVGSHPAPEERFDPNGSACGFYWTEGTRGLGWAVDAVPTLKGGSSVGIPSPPAVWTPDGRVVTPAIEDAERLQGFQRGWTQPAEEVARPSARWRLAGNAVSVNVARWIGEQLASPDRYHPHGDRPLLPGETWPSAAYNVGEGRFSSSVSEYPVLEESPPLAEFLDLDDARPLSHRAVSGFLSRFEASTLSRPPGFVEALRAHREKMAEASANSE